MILEEKNAHERDKYIFFNKELHLYSFKPNNVTSQDFMSVTTVIKSCFEEFDTEKIIEKIINSKNKRAIYKNKNAEEIKNIFRKNNEIAINEGIKLHDDIELYFNNEKYDNLSKEFSYFKNFVTDHYFLTPFRTEWKIYDENFKIAGTIDMAFKNNNGTIDIYDWKRSKEIKCSNKFQKFSTKSYISHLPDINFIHYSLQLNAYKYILEKNYDLKVSNMFIVCLHPDNKNENYLLFPIKDMKNDIHNIFLNYKN
tara:strand:+ start:409 stop:1170 length:762 start_codon:yes stop_codon:yes gene_type:complete